jgi:hypothetical protein
MKNARINFLFFIALLLSANCQGTLIVAVPTNDGMMIASDKLLTIMSHGQQVAHVDGFDKVLLLSPTAAVGFTGFIGLHQKDEESETNCLTEPKFAIDFAKYYFMTNRVDNFDGQQFANSMGEKVSNYFAAMNAKLDLTESSVCQFLVFRTTPDHCRRTLVATLFFGQSESNLTVTSTRFKEYVQRDNDPARIMAFGQPFVPQELMHGNDPRFDDLRGNWMINKFLPNPPRIRDSELADAQIFAQCLMQAAGEKSILLNTNSAIGTTMRETFLSF